MKQKDKRLAELMHWVLEDTRRQNIPTIIEHTIKRYKIGEETARNYAIQIMVKLGKLSQPMRVSYLVRELQNEKDSTTKLHYPKFAKASELDG